MKGPKFIHVTQISMMTSYRCQIQGINDQETATIDMAAILPVTGETIIAVDALSSKKHVLYFAKRFYE